jgi:HAD superfamily hydrolase (TIGR01484 family)
MHAMIFCDIDGCLNAGKNVAFDLPVLGEIRDIIVELGDFGVGFTLCTGRPQPYAEAMAQLLAIRLPVICELGALLYDPGQDRYVPLIPPATQADLEQLRRTVTASGYLTEDRFFEIGNAYSLCITGPHFERLNEAEFGAEMQALMDQNPLAKVSWSRSHTAIDITPQGVDKATGVAHVLARFGLNPADATGIGDSQGDISFLSMVGQVCCPFNASPTVRVLADHVSRHSHACGTLDILQRIKTLHSGGSREAGTT